MHSPETQAKIAAYRQKVATNEVTIEDCKEIVALLRQDRKAAAAASATSTRKKAIAAIPDAGSLLDEMMGNS